MSQPARVRPRKARRGETIGNCFCIPDGDGLAEGLVDRLIELGKRFDYRVYPDRDHGLSEGPGTSLHLRLLIARYRIIALSPPEGGLDERVGSGSRRIGYKAESVIVY